MATLSTSAPIHTTITVCAILHLQYLWILVTIDITLSLQNSPTLTPTPTKQPQQRSNTRNPRQGSYIVNTESSPRNTIDDQIDFNAYLLIQQPSQQNGIQMHALLTTTDVPSSTDPQTIRTTTTTPPHKTWDNRTTTKGFKTQIILMRVLWETNSPLKTAFIESSQPELLLNRSGVGDVNYTSKPPPIYRTPDPTLQRGG